MLFYTVCASSFNPLLGRTKFPGRCWAAMRMSHPEPSSHAVDGLNIGGQRGRRSVVLRHTSRRRAHTHLLCMNVWSLVVFSNHSAFHQWSAQSATFLLLSDELTSSCAAGTNGCLLSWSAIPCIPTWYTGERWVKPVALEQNVLTYSERQCFCLGRRLSKQKMITCAKTLGVLPSWQRLCVEQMSRLHSTACWRDCDCLRRFPHRFGWRQFSGDTKNILSKFARKTSLLR